MGYKNAVFILPDDLIIAIQRHIDGEYLYIPRKEGNKKAWGESSNARQLLYERNALIFAQYRLGTNVGELAEAFCLSPKTIYKILSEMKK